MWESRAIDVINDHIAEAASMNEKEKRKHINQFYPFGERRGYPYAAWNKAMNRILGPSPAKCRAAQRRAAEDEHQGRPQWIQIPLPFDDA